MSDWSEIVMGEMTGTKELMKSGFKRYSGVGINRPCLVRDWLRIQGVRVGGGEDDNYALIEFTEISAGGRGYAKEHDRLMF